MKKVKCKVCSTRFPITKEALYLVKERVAPLSALLSATAQTFECIDCPKCGCQNAVNIRMVDTESEEVKEDGE